MFVCGGLVQSSYGTEQLTSGTNSRQAKQQALAAIPYGQLNQQSRAKISDVLEKPSIYRRLPITSIDVDPDYFIFLIRHPEVIVNIWQIMGVTKMTADRTGPFSLKTNDGVGAVSDVELIYGTNNLHIYYAAGTYSGPILKRKLNGRCVMVLRTEYLRGPDGSPQTKNSLDVFLRVENATVSLIAKTLNPLVGSTADHNFVESLNFLQRLNETTEKNGVGDQRMAGRLTKLTKQVRNDFVKVAGLVYERTGKTAAASPKNQFGQAGTPMAIPPQPYQQAYPVNALNQQGYPPVNQGRYAQPGTANMIPATGYAPPQMSAYSNDYSQRRSTTYNPAVHNAGGFVPQYYNQPVRSAGYERPVNPQIRQATYPGQGYYRR